MSPYTRAQQIVLGRDGLPEWGLSFDMADALVEKIANAIEAAMQEVLDNRDDIQWAKDK